MYLYGGVFFYINKYNLIKKGIMIIIKKMKIASSVILFAKLVKIRIFALLAMKI